LVSLLGWGLINSVLGDWFTRYSYDVPFMLDRKEQPKNEVVIVYLDDDSYFELNQFRNRPWDRALHTELVERLTELQARLVVFDVIFDEPWEDPKVDDAFAKEIRKSQRCVLGGLRTKNLRKESGVEETAVVPPLTILRTNAAGWGVVGFESDPADNVIRQGPQWTEDQPTLSWLTANLLQARVSKRLPRPPANFCLRYYGPADFFSSVSYVNVLKTNGVNPGLFKDKIVLVGSHPSLTPDGDSGDAHPTPLTKFDGKLSSGVEIQATALVNLLRQDWLTRLPGKLEFILVLLVGFSAGSGLCKLRPWTAVKVAVSAAMGFVIIGMGIHLLFNTWFAWMITLVQIFSGLFLSLIFNAARWSVEREVTLRSLELYISPARARQVLKDPELLRPVGKKQEVSILFSDIAGFSDISGGALPDDIFEQLNRYYEATLTCIREADGTVLQLIGDAIFAVWNAPFDQADHKARACHAALQLRDKLVTFDASVRGRPLHTRIGLHTGSAMVGNLGSRERLVYTAIGSTTNLASRLEGMNEHLGTKILASRAIQKSVESQIVCRCVGHFQPKGLNEFIEVYELIDTVEKAESSRAWLEAFEKALHHFQRREFNDAEAGFRRTIELANKDGPSEFYLQQIEHFRKEPPPSKWNGKVSLKEK
jgi:adenylate cyclase